MRAASMHASSVHFTEYPVPAGLAPRYITIGTDREVWFGNGVNLGSATSNAVLGRLHGGKIVLVTLPSPSQAVLMGFATTYGTSVWGIAIDNAIDQGQDDLVQASSATKIPALLPDNDDNQYWALAAGPDGRLWYAHCLEACGAFPAAAYLSSRNADGSGGPTVTFSNYMFAIGIAGGPDGNLYAAVHYGGPPGPPDSFVFKISTNGTVLQQIELPTGSNPEGITPGSDGNVWVTEPGTNQIARIATGGTLTQFALPTANAGPQQIAAASDGALWFTEMNANAIGRITTNGTISEYPVPTQGSQPFGIVSPGRCLGARATVWFTEFGAGKIGKLRI